MTNKFEIKGITSFTAFSNEAIKECRINELNIINTKYGDLIPQYNNPGIRRKDFKSMSFYENGNIKTISLEEQTKITTSIGKYSAELLTFYESGELFSLFPLNGQISFAWSEEEEALLAEKYDFNFPFAQFSSKIIGIRFFESGKFQSIILWPGETAKIETPSGNFLMRIGFRVYENGNLRSFEPAGPIRIKTPIGDIRAFDTLALGADADFNSVKYDIDGNLIGVSTPDDILVTDRISGKQMNITAQTRAGLMSNDPERLPIVIVFDGDRVEISGISFMKNDFDFTIIEKEIQESCMGNCEGCSGCV